MKKLKRLITNPTTSKLEMKTLYEYHAKLGTAGSTLVWLLEKGRKGARIYGIDEESTHVSPYMEGQAFRYAEFNRYLIWDISYTMYPNEDFLFISK